MLPQYNFYWFRIDNKHMAEPWLNQRLMDSAYRSGTPPPALLHRFWPPAFLGSTQKKTEKKDGEEKIKDDIISKTLWPRRASLALSLRILSLRKTKLICCILNISLLFLIKQANNIYELPACLFEFDTRRSIWLN